MNESTLLNQESLPESEQAGTGAHRQVDITEEKQGMRLALDIDGTITADPDFFASYAKGVLRTGGEVHVVSTRSPEARAETLDELRELNVKFSFLHLIPHISAAQDICPHTSLDWFQRHLWLKVDYALRNSLSHFVDDDPKVLGLLARFAPLITAISFQRRAELYGLNAGMMPAGGRGSKK